MSRKPQNKPHDDQRPAIAFDKILGKAPPTDMEAERGVIGSILLDSTVLDEVAVIVKAEDFFDTAHEKLFRHLLALHESGKKSDLLLLLNRLKAAGELESVGGPAYIHQVFEAVPHAAHANYYAEIVHGKSVLRAVIQAGTSMVRDAIDEAAESREVLNSAEQRVMSILDGKSAAMPVRVREVLSEAMERISKRINGDDIDQGIPTGLTALDRATGGLMGSQLIVIAGRPAMGKSALAMNIAEHIAITHRIPTLIVSLEMAKMELADRMLCSRASIDGHRMKNGTITQAEMERLMECASEINDAPLYIDDAPSRNVTEIAAAARRVKRKEGGLGCMVVDYLQLIEADNQKDQRQEQVAKMTRRLKVLARELDVPLIILAQLNRQTETSRDNRPRLSHLRESGAIEQDADIVLFVHREEYYLVGEEKRNAAGKAEIIIAKQRSGPTTEIDVCWEKQYTRFVDAKIEPPPYGSALPPDEAEATRF